MLRQVYIILFLLIILSCQKSTDSLEPEARLSSIAGTWQLTELEKGTYGKKYWEPAVGNPFVMIIRDDGAILDADSLTLCCGPNSLTLNGRSIDIQSAMALAPNPLCVIINCTFCPTWELEWKDSQIILTNCDGTRQKFIRK